MGTGFPGIMFVPQTAAAPCGGQPTLALLRLIKVIFLWAPDVAMGFHFIVHGTCASKCVSLERNVATHRM